MRYAAHALSFQLWAAALSGCVGDVRMAGRPHAVRHLARHMVVVDIFQKNLGVQGRGGVGAIDPETASILGAAVSTKPCPHLHQGVEVEVTGVAG